MELLRTEFDDKRYPHNYLLKTPSMGGSGLYLRLTQAAENLGLDMPMAHQLVPEDESEDGRPYFLFAVALTHEADYKRLLGEVDRLTDEHVRSVHQSIAETNSVSEIDLLMRDYEAQEPAHETAEITRVLHLPYEELGKEGVASTAIDELMADYQLQRPLDDWQLERDGLEWEL